jgi:hypothetical protein
LLVDSSSHAQANARTCWQDDEAGIDWWEDLNDRERERFPDLADRFNMKPGASAGEKTKSYSCEKPDASDGKKSKGPNTDEKPASAGKKSKTIATPAAKTTGDGYAKSSRLRAEERRYEQARYFATLYAEVFAMLAADKKSKSQVHDGEEADYYKLECGSGKDGSESSCRGNFSTLDADENSRSAKVTGQNNATEAYGKGGPFIVIRYCPCPPLRGQGRLGKEDEGKDRTAADATTKVRTTHDVDTMPRTS